LAVDVNKMEDIWSDEDIVTLIQFYEANPCLYVITHADYRNRDKKRILENEIACILKKPGETYASIHSSSHCASSHHTARHTSKLILALAGTNYSSH